MTKDKKGLYDEAQRLLVASLLADSSTANRVLELISEDDVEEPSLSLIFSSIAELARADEDISTFTVAEDLQSKGLLAQVGGPPALYSLAVDGEKALLNALPAVYARIVKESSAKLKISRILQESTKGFKDDSGIAAVDAVSDLQENLNESLLRLSDSSTITKLNEDFDAYMEMLDERLKISIENENMGSGLQGIPSLLPTLDSYTTGWLPGQLITVGARTSIGKSIFAVNCAVSAGRANKSTLLFSLEMEKDEVEDRILASTTGISLNALKQGRLTEEETQLLKEQMKIMKSMKLVIDTEPIITVDMIRARALRQAQSPDGLDFIIIDYLQLITPTGSYSSRQEAVASMSRQMKILAKQLGVPIMVVVQLNRKDNSKDTENTLPNLDQIRESGAIAQDSDIVILLHRDAALDDTTPHTLIILDKNRNGEAKKTIRCHSNLECSLFREVKRVKDVEDRLSEDDLDDLAEEIDLDDFDDFDLSEDDQDLLDDSGPMDW